ncbi:Kinesin-related protein 1 [Diplonema papillatum]|nr:Kinesin-related protein 1 [Diplonema papillatum]
MSASHGSSVKLGLKTVTNAIQVMIRCRPFNKRETEWFEKNNKVVRPVVQMEGQKVIVLDPDNDYQPKDAFSYNNCFWSCSGYESPNGMADQEDIYETTGKVLLAQALEGYNGCVFAYGQTASGKTYTMLGSPANPGVSYLLIHELFKQIAKETEDNPHSVFTVEISFMEIYNEQARDLFNKKVKMGEYSPVKIRQHPVLGIQVEGLLRVRVNCALDCEKQMERGVSERALAETKMNATSSRSHAICQISIQHANAATGLRRNSLLNLVDLAGSERLKMTGVSGAQLTEAKNINQSLSTLRKVFDVLIANSKSKKQTIPPYRESMLTWVLKESLGGNSRTMMIAAITPCEESLEDTMSTLRYAQKAKAIVCKVIQNEQPNAKMVSNLKNQVDELQKQLEDRLRNGEANEERILDIREEYRVQIEETENALREAESVERQMKEREEELQKQLEGLQVKTTEIQQQVNFHKKQKFSAAFRSAFRIRKESTEVASIKEQMTVLQGELDACTETIASLEGEKEEANSNCRQLEEELAARLKSINKLKAEKEEVAGKCRDLQSSVAKLTRENEASTSRGNKLSDDIAELKVVHERAISSLKKRHSSEMTAGADDISALKADHERAIASRAKRLEDEIAARLKDKADFDTENRNLQSKLSVSESENWGLQSRMASSETENKSLQTRLDSSETECRRLQSQVASFDAENRNLQSRLASSEASGRNLQSQLALSAADGQETQARVKSAEGRISSLLDEMKGIRQQLEAEQRLSEQLRGQVAKCMCTQLKDEARQMNMALETSHRKLARVDDENQRLKNEAYAREAAMTRRLDEQKAQADDLRAAHDMYKKQYISLRRMHEADTKIIEAMSVSSPRADDFASPLLKALDSGDLYASVSPADLSTSTRHHSASPSAVFRLASSIAPLSPHDAASSTRMRAMRQWSSTSVSPTPVTPRAMPPPDS